MNFTDQDIQQLEERGVSQAQIIEQYETLKEGIPFVDLQSAATENNGLLILEKEDQEAFVRYFEEKTKSLDVLKFIPASGAATRMFKFLFEFIENYDPSKESIREYIAAKGAPELGVFFEGLESFPFYENVQASVKTKAAGSDEDENQKNFQFVKAMLDEKGLNFGQMPKGLFPFHNYKQHVATAFDEHLFEGALYASSEGVARLHFTISEAHQERFHKQFEKRRTYIEQETAVRFDVSYSYQKSSTDTVALTTSGSLLRDAKEKLIFRPGGHGSLIKNLNEQQAAIIFIKNIDNVVVQTYKDQVAFNKKMLAGKLVSLQEKSFAYLELLDSEKSVSQTTIDEVVHFLHNELHVKIGANFENDAPANQVTTLRTLLDRPIRVCGMVKNQGEPGGGPFWVRDKSGTESLQIIESIQIDPNNPDQQEILKGSTHFNPVDIVCGVKNYKGKKFDLLKFVDYKAGFIASKSFEGQEIKALEHPGLWNGGMAYWNTIFVEVPLDTFNPVKTVNDLLKPMHQVN